MCGLLHLMPPSPFLPRLLYNLRFLGQTSVGMVRLWGRDLPGGESSLLEFSLCVQGLFPPSHSISVWWQRGAGGGHPCCAGEELGSTGEQQGWGHPGKGSVRECRPWIFFPAPGSHGLAEYLPPHHPCGVFSGQKHLSSQDRKGH